MGITDNLPLISSQNKIIKIAGYILFGFIFLIALVSMIHYPSIPTIADPVVSKPVAVIPASSALNEYSNRTDGSRDIRVYKTKDGKVRLTVIKNTNPKDFGVKGLTNEIKYLVVNLHENTFEKPLQTYNLDGHTAVSTSMIQAYSEGGAVTGIPTEYITVIAYPERNMLITFRSNGKGSAQGDGLTQEDYYKIINDFKI
jgi:hypothetical protein